MPSNNPKLDIVSTIPYMKFHPNPSIVLKKIKRKPFFFIWSFFKSSHSVKTFAGFCRRELKIGNTLYIQFSENFLSFVQLKEFGIVVWITMG